MVEVVEVEPKWRGRLVRYAPLLFWIGIIFVLSSGQGAMSETSRIIRPVLKFLFPGAPEYVIAQYHGYIRKFAHFAEYAVLAVFAAYAFGRSSISLMRVNWFACSMLLIVVTATMDEFNQSFNSKRTGSPWDVVIDISGGLTACVLIWLLRRAIRNDPETAATVG
jgi:VanZ family protein